MMSVRTFASTIPKANEDFKIEEEPKVNRFANSNSFSQLLFHYKNFQGSSS
jgi:hypothetical protein